MTDGPCLLCEKHEGRGDLVGPVVHADDLVVVTLRMAGAAGYGFVETRRHVAELAALTDAEAAAVGLAVARLARGLRAELRVTHVHTFVAGLGSARAHFHQHVFVRHAGTPPGHPWWPEWPGAPAGDNATLARRLTPYFR